LPSVVALFAPELGSQSASQQQAAPRLGEDISRGRRQCRWRLAGEDLDPDPVALSGDANEYATASLTVLEDVHHQFGDDQFDLVGRRAEFLAPAYGVGASHSLGPVHRAVDREDGWGSADIDRHGFPLTRGDAG